MSGSVMVGQRDPFKRVRKNPSKLIHFKNQSKKFMENENVYKFFNFDWFYTNLVKN